MAYIHRLSLPILAFPALYISDLITSKTPLTMKHWLIPRYVLPDFTWTDNVRTVLSDRIPSTPQPTHPPVNLLYETRSYCHWVGIPYDNQIAQLLFGLILKWSGQYSDRGSVVYASCTKAGLPVPRVICYSDHPDTLHAPISILMTCVPGE